jgi:hypothetical protein
VVSSVAEAEFGALFVNAKEGTVTRKTLYEMGHKQDAAELRTENTTADGIINNIVNIKRSKAMDICSTRSKTEWNSTNSMSVGRQVTPIWETISLRIIIQCITNA